MSAAVRRRVWLKRVMADARLTPRAKVAAYWIAERVRRGGAVKYATLADEACCCRRASIRLIQQLETGGWLRVERRGGKRANIYRLALPDKGRWPAAIDKKSKTSRAAVWAAMQRGAPPRG